MAQTVIGLDIGSWSIKAAIFDSTLRAFSLVDVIEHRVPRTPDGTPADTSLRDLVRATLRSVDDYDALATSIAGGRVLSRELELPFSDERRIRSVLGFQLEGKLPGDLDSLVYDYSLIEEDEESAHHGRSRRGRSRCPATRRGHLGAEKSARRARDRALSCDIRGDLRGPRCLGERVLLLCRTTPAAAAADVARHADA